MNGPQQIPSVAAAAAPPPPLPASPGSGSVTGSGSGSARTRARTLSSNNSSAAPATLDTSPQALLFKHQRHLQPEQTISDPGSPSTQALDKIMSSLVEQQQQQQQQQQQLHHYHQQHQQYHLQQQQQQQQQQQHQQHHYQQQHPSATTNSTSTNLKRNSTLSQQTLAPLSTTTTSTTTSTTQSSSSFLPHSALSSDSPPSAAAPPYIHSAGSHYSASPAANTLVGSDLPSHHNHPAPYSVAASSSHHLPSQHQHQFPVPNTPPPHTASFGIATADASGSAISNSNPLQHRPFTPLKSSFPGSISSDLPESPSATINFDPVSSTTGTITSTTGHSPPSHQYKPFSTSSSSSKPGRKHPMGTEKHMGSLPTIHYQNGRGRSEGKTTFMGVSMKHLSLVVLLLQNSTLVLMMRYSRVNVDPDQPLYLASTAVFFAELIKLLACVSVLVYTTKSLPRTFYILRKEILEQPKEIAKMLVPSGLYALQNNLLYIALSNLEAATFQVTYQMKILSTALFSVAMLGRRLTRQKWLALILLMIGVTLVQLQNVGSAKSSPAVVVVQDDADELDTDGVDLTGGDGVVDASATAAVVEEDGVTSQNPIIGLLAVMTSCVSSGFAGCYFEKILKGSETDMWVRNIQLGISGSLFSFLAMFYDRQKIYEGGLLQGYSTITWMVVINQALGGLLVAIVVKYADNILKGFATSLSIIISGIISVYFFDFEPSMQFQIGTMVVILATFLYGRPDAPLPGSMFGIRREKKYVPLDRINVVLKHL
ncbi:hypothetical protein DFQ27_002000 [Actinomortierella ambigua]|uniref:Nucleotide-sugar transporter n=1 Tax=Actinomortierella ambigua TaxID=1343610 RepID=A0A9P6U7N1_9FUNG|nr:hypothetical protein DFQ27_002000 [Actinomortierella ambigua]